MLSSSSSSLSPPEVPATATAITPSSSVSSSSLAGVTFDRSITKFPNDGATLTLNFYRNNTSTATTKRTSASATTSNNVEDDDNDYIDVCTTHDIYGDNTCHYNWDDNIIVKYSIESVTQFTNQDIVVGNFIIDNRIEYNFTCVVCGEDCVLEIPVIHFNYTFPMPDCPVKPKKRTHTLLYQLWKSSPTHGFITTSIQGTISIIKTTTTTATATTIPTTRNISTNGNTLPNEIAEGGRIRSNSNSSIDGRKNNNETIVQIDIQVNVR